MDGSVLLPGPWTSSASARSFASLIPPLPPCWTRRQAPSLREFLRLSARPRTRPRRGRRAEPPAAATLGVAVACRPWAPAGPADRTGSGQEQKCACKKKFTARPTSPELSLAPSHFRVLLLRRLRLPLPLTAAYCRCRCRQDALGDHLAACSRYGVLCARDAPLQRAAARVCREAGATVTTNVLVRDLNVAPGRQDDRRIEVIATQADAASSCSA